MTEARLAAPDSPADHVFAPVWDLPIRLFHWLLIAALAVSWWSGERHAMDWHRRSGYVVLGLLVFRLYWGVFGGRTARFAQFVRGPRAALTYARSIARPPHAATAGHNPIAGWSVVLMLATLLTMVAAGLFAVDIDGLESGPLADVVSFETGRAAAHLHHLVFNALLGLVALHVAAVMFYLVRLRHDLVTPMISGLRRAAAHEPVTTLGASYRHAVLGTIIAVAVAFLVASGLHG